MNDASVIKFHALEEYPPPIPGPVEQTLESLVAAEWDGRQLLIDNAGEIAVDVINDDTGTILEALADANHLAAVVETLGTPNTYHVHVDGTDYVPDGNFNLHGVEGGLSYDTDPQPPILRFVGLRGVYVNGLALAIEGTEIEDDTIETQWTELVEEGEPILHTVMDDDKIESWIMPDKIPQYVRRNLGGGTKVYTRAIADIAQFGGIPSYPLGSGSWSGADDVLKQEVPGLEVPSEET
jgi:hypothetical protein